MQIVIVKMNTVISIHALLAESDYFFGAMQIVIVNFYPRSPCGERRRNSHNINREHHISIHALLAESDLWVLRKVPILGIFLSTLSLRRATPASITPTASRRNFYPRSPCGERQINSLMIRQIPYFYPRSPCGERHNRIFHVRSFTSISIHALLAESDLVKLVSNSNITTFLSTLSLRRATSGIKATKTFLAEFLSTLSLRRATERENQHLTNLQHFYPRSPCGERQRANQSEHCEQSFLSTLSLRRATTAYFFLADGIEFLSTLSLRRATFSA